MRFAVFASGRGSNLQAVIAALKKKKIRAELQLVVSDCLDAYALIRARKAKIKTLCVEPRGFPDKESFDREIVKYLKAERIDFIVLAGFMRILSPYFIKAYRGKILNIHPSLLPAFKGAAAIRDAFNYGAKVTGVTVHFVDEKIDHGPIIAQELVPILPKDSLRSLEEKIHRVEHRLYPWVIDRFARRKIRVQGRKVFLR